MRVLHRFLPLGVFRNQSISSVQLGSFNQSLILEHKCVRASENVSRVRQSVGILLELSIKVLLFTQVLEPPDDLLSLVSSNGRDHIL